MELAILESPYAGDIRFNRFFAETVARSLLFKGFNCMASHLYYPHFLDEHNEKERELGIEAGLQWAEMEGINHIFFALPPRRFLPSKGMLDAYERHKATGRIIQCAVHDPLSGEVLYRLPEQAFFDEDGWAAGMKKWTTVRGRVEMGELSK